MEIQKYIDGLSNGKENDEKIPGLSELISILNLGTLKRVNKPWGFEIWIADGTESQYAFKLIYLKEGTKTSLQYHDEKSEHNFVLAGEVRLHFENQDNGEISTTVVPAGNIIKVSPPAIHRVEAITDVVLIETSTTELDDVVRLSDDYNRPDGRIDSEHGQS